ncbi:hypothetical protein MPSEU_000041900 [Mayamaea pseudoterrestris]|nr:hypothetical protein MPSEU_000041900 [Mayamaea pseudoterrestris]
MPTSTLSKGLVYPRSRRDGTDKRTLHTMNDITVVFFICSILTTSLLMLALHSPSYTPLDHRMMMTMNLNEQMALEDFHHTTSKRKHRYRLSEYILTHRNEWSNSHNVVHVITSRFMQHQSKLKHLAMARLKLLEAITIPSLQQQTNQDFLWILRVDPHLDKEVMALLMDVTKSVPNLVIHLTNDNREGFRSIPKDAYKHLANSDSRQLLESYIDAAQTRTVLETRLDADDALMVSFVDHIQQDASKQFHHVPDQWMVWCIENHLEWQQNSPWHEGESAIVGFRAPHCVTPGLTWGYPVGVVREASMTGQHHTIHKRLSRCDKASGRGAKGKCMHRLKSAWPMALRARTITSAGMANLVLDHETDPMAASLQNSRWKDLQEELWGHLESLFGVSPEDLHRVRKQLADHTHDIAVDALKGQCTAGHSCKKRSKAVLRKLANVSAHVV